MSAYDKCKKCGERAVHLAEYVIDNSRWRGDGDDNEGNRSRYADDYPPSPSDYIELFARICFECGELVDIGIEMPREKVVDTSEREEIAV